MASGGVDLFENKLNTNRYGHIVKICGQKVLAVILEAMLDDISTKATVKEQLQEIGIYEQYKKREDKDKLDSVAPLSHDITFLYSICLKLWAKLGIPEDDCLRKLLKTIKTERNIISHEDFILSHIDLEGKLNALDTLLKNTISEAERAYPLYHSQFIFLKSEIRDSFVDVRMIIREPLDHNNPDHYKKHKQEQEIFRSQANNCIHDSIQQTLKSELESKCRCLLFDWLCKYGKINPSNFSVELAIQNAQEFSRIQIPEKQSTVDQNHILEIKTAGNGEGHVVIISGEAGTGKSTLLSYIAEQWTAGDTSVFSSLFNYSLLFYAEFRNKRYGNLDDYLKDLLLVTVSDYSMDRVKAVMRQSKCLFLVDGFDEHNLNSMQLFQDILLFSSTNIKIIVTTRPINTKKLTEIVDQSPLSRINLSLLGIPSNSVNLSIRKIAKLILDDSSNEEDIIADLTETYKLLPPEMQDMTRIPLYNNLIIVLLIKKPELKTSITTITKLFQIIQDQKIERLIKKIGNLTKKEDILEFHDHYERMSLNAHLRQQYELDDVLLQSFNEECCRLKLPFDDVMSSYFNTKYSVKPLEVESIFCFKHRTEQEFAAAGAICKLLMKDDKQDIDKQDDDGNILLHCMSKLNPDVDFQDKEILKGLDKILVFTTGKLNSLNRLDMYAKHVVKLTCDMIADYSSEIDLFLEHLLESENNLHIRNAITVNLKSKLRWSVKESKNISSLACLLTHTTPYSIELELYDDPATVPSLVDALKVAESKEVSVELDLHNHYFGEVPRISDNYISSNVESFEGCLSEKGISCIGKDIKRLLLKIDEGSSLTALSKCLPSLTNLFYLWLRIEMDYFKSIDVRSIHRLHDGFNLHLEFIIRKHHPSSDSLAEIINQLWPTITDDGNIENPKHVGSEKKNSKFMKVLTTWFSSWNKNEYEHPRYKEHMALLITKSHYSYEEIRSLIQCLKIKKLECLWIETDVSLTDDQKNNLKELVASGMECNDFKVGPKK